jgi:hypothetical protein
MSTYTPNDIGTMEKRPLQMNKSLMLRLSVR